MRFSKYLLPLIGCFIGTATATAKEIVIASGEWPPFQGKNIENNGFATELVRKAFANSGSKEKVNIKFKYFTWSRSLDFTRDGTTHATFLWSHKKDREKDFLYSDKLVDVSYVLFHLKKTKLEWKTVPDLKKFKIGITEGYSYGKEFDQAASEGVLKVSAVPKDLQNFKKLVAGRIDIFPNELNAGYELIKANFSAKERANLTHHPTALRNAPHYLLFSKKYKESQELLELFNRGLHKLKKTNEYNKIVGKFTASKS